MKSKIWQEIRSLSDIELSAKLEESEKRLFDLKFRNSTTKVKNPLEIRSIRKNVARMKTLFHEREMAKNNKSKEGK